MNDHQPGDLVKPRYYSRDLWLVKQAIFFDKGRITLGMDGYEGNVSASDCGIAVAVIRDSRSMYDIVYLVFPSHVGWAWDDMLISENQIAVDLNKSLT